jgi:hypothetical protein
MKKITILILSLLFVFNDMYSQYNHPDFPGLMQIYFSLGGPNWTKNIGWKQGVNGTNCDPIQINLEGLNRVCIGNPAVIYVVNTNSFVSYLWNNGETGFSIEVLPDAPSTIYKVTATDINGCQSYAEWEITVDSFPELSVIGNTFFCKGGSTTITANAIPIGNYEFLWGFDGNIIGTDDQLTITIPGIYSLGASTESGCLSRIQIIITEFEALEPKLNNVSLCDNISDTLTVVTPGVNSATYSWSLNGQIIPNEINDFIIIDIPGVYCVNVSDQNGCFGNICTTIINNFTPELNVTKRYNVCNTIDESQSWFINFGDQTSISNGIWINEDNIEVDLNNLDSVSFDGILPGIYKFKFLTNTAIFPCNDVEKTMLVNVVNCKCNVIVYDTITVIDTNFITETVLVSVTDTLIININISNTNNPAKTNLIKVFPNPASTHITIDNGDYQLMPNYQIRILNSVGQGVFYTPIEQKEYFLDLQSWTGKGTYFMQIIDNAGIIKEIKKIILQ